MFENEVVKKEKTELTNAAHDLYTLLTASSQEKSLSKQQHLKD